MKITATTIEGENVIIKAEEFDWLCEQAEILSRTREVNLRDTFAAKAMQGLLATGDAYFDDNHAPGDWSWYADAAYKIADIMLEERDK